MTDEEKVLRNYIRKAIRIVEDKKEKQKLQEKSELVNIIRKMILQEKEREPAYDNTGLNVLNSLFLDTGILGRMRIGYKELKSTPEQRNSFKEHMIYHILSLLNLERAKDHPGDQSKELDASIELTEQDDFTMRIGDDSPLMGQEPEKKSPEEEEEEELESFKIPGTEDGDTTGIKQAFAVFNQTEVKQSLLNYWKRLGNEADKDTFYDNLSEQLKMYFDTWEEEVQSEIEAAGGEYRSDEIEIDETPPEGLEDEEEELYLEPEGEGEGL
jgi:hypothetical protein